MTPKKLKKVVNDWRTTIEIPHRASVTFMTMFVRDLLKESGREEAARSVNALVDELENMDTLGIVNEKIWE